MKPWIQNQGILFNREHSETTVSTMPVLICLMQTVKPNTGGFSGNLDLSTNDVDDEFPLELHSTMLRLSNVRMNKSNTRDAEMRTALRGMGKRRGGKLLHRRHAARHIIFI